jgi:hypothetical protein
MNGFRPIHPWGGKLTICQSQDFANHPNTRNHLNWMNLPSDFALKDRNKFETK